MTTSKMEQDLLDVPFESTIRTKRKPGKKRRKSNLTGDAAPVMVGTSEDELALKFSERHADELRFVTDRKGWLRWDGARWQEEPDVKIMDLSRKLCRDVLEDLKDADPATERRLGSAHTVWAVVSLAQGDHRHCIRADQLDARPWLLNTPGGTLDLVTGQLRPHDRNELHTKLTAATPGGDCPTFLRVLERVQPQEDVRDYIQRLFGYGMTGSSREHVLPFFYGMGRNGKGTIAHAMRRALGDYGVDTPAETLMETHNPAHPTELARLRGARFVVGSEIDAGRRWNESRVKRLTGGDPITARYMREDFFTFDPTHTLLIIGNSKPGLRQVDEAIRARIQLVEFAVTIPASERDTKLEDKLAVEFGGILQWALEGCIAWQSSGLMAPKSVQDSTGAYFDGEDNIATWIAECCERRGRITLQAAHLSFRNWAERNGMQMLGRNQFGSALEARGFQRSAESRSGKPTFQGLSLPVTPDPRFSMDD